MRGSITDKIYDSVRSLPPGTMVFPEDYSQLGTGKAVNMALSRLAGDGYLSRLARGLYYIPKTCPVVGLIRPALEEIAQAVAEKNRIRIRPTGAYALNKLGLSTQVPTRVVFLTNGQHRILKVAKATIVFKRTTPKVMAVENDIMFLAIQAIQELGKEGVTEEVITKLTEILRKIDPEKFRNDTKLAPGWIRQILYAIANKIYTHD